MGLAVHQHIDLTLEPLFFGLRLIILKFILVNFPVLVGQDTFPEGSGGIVILTDMLLKKLTGLKRKT